MTETTQIIIRREPDIDPDPSFLYQKDLWEEFKDRREAYERGDFGFIGIYAVTEFVVKGTVQTLRSAGLWGIEDDSSEGYLQEIEREEIANLQEIVEAIKTA